MPVKDPDHDIPQVLEHLTYKKIRHIKSISARIGANAKSPETLKYKTADPTDTMLDPLAPATLLCALPVSQSQWVPKCFSIRE